MVNAASQPKIKCVVWDLDDTLWDGVLLESDSLPALRPRVREVIEEFDQRGILQSVSSKNDFDPAMAALTQHGLGDYFLYPQISWGAKSKSIGAIAEKLNIGIDTFAFVDDQIFEREEVQSVHPDLRVFCAESVKDLPGRDDFKPLFITADSRNRRKLYQLEAQRSRAQEEFQGPEESFLRTLDLALTLKPAAEEDLHRAEELTVRTNQLNTTGVSYSVDDLRALIESDAHQVVVAELSDKYGTYGAIGLVLLSTSGTSWCIELFLMSCRVMSRGVGGAILTALRQTCRQRQLELRAQFRPTDRNRIMYVTYRFAGFEDEGDVLINDLTRIPSLPDYMKINVEPALGWVLSHE